ncbi:MAG: hypothetical protein NZ988_02870 [Thaumarchaeota archaeon]|nr:hypothetical protein [Candidatus Calditenuaceae archaeon]MDW8186974.1 hypothetical protein [Nitrososphaerota archaeon]
MRRAGASTLLLLLILGAVSPLIFVANSTSPSDVYGLLRSFGSYYKGGAPQGPEVAYDIKVDKNGIYIVGQQSSDAPRPYLLILNRDHSYRCSSYLLFPPETDPFGSSFSVDVYGESVFVAGVYRYTSGGSNALFVTRFRAADCSVERVYLYDLRDSPTKIPEQFGEGIDIAVDENNVYVLIGMISPEGFAILKLDHSLTFIAARNYLTEIGAVIASSFALSKDYIFVAAGPLEDRSAITEAKNMIIMRINKNNLDPTSFVIQLSLSEDLFFTGAEILVEERVHEVDLYLIYGHIFRSYPHDVIEVLKLRVPKAEERSWVLPVVWHRRYFISYVYTFPYTGTQITQPVPEWGHIQILYDYPIDAAISDGLIFVGGFMGHSSLREKLASKTGFILAIDSESGSEVYSLRIQGPQEASSDVMVLGIDARDGCVFPAGVTNSYLMEYVFSNVLHEVVEVRADQIRSDFTELSPADRPDRPDAREWSVAFNADTGASWYSFYGVFCHARLLNTITESTTVTITVPETSTFTTTTTTTLTETSATTSTQTSYTTVTTTTTRTAAVTTTSTIYRRVTDTEVVWVTRETTRTTTETAAVFDTRSTTSTLFLTRMINETLTHTNLFQATTFVTEVNRVVLTLTRFTTSLIYEGGQFTGPTTTTTVWYNATHTVTQVRLPLDLTTVFFFAGVSVPLLLLPVPLIIIARRILGKKVVIKSHDAAPSEWQEGDQPILDEKYLKPCVVNIKRGSTVTFINEDDEDHVLWCYRGPLEKSFLSNTIEPKSKWKYKFDTPGVYYLKSTKKPYIGGIIDVSE